jgi:hypothetical protein
VREISQHRFLHEDTLGSTIATTSLWGDRLDEYDYTDYGVPIHSPVALDGRWITDIADHTSHPDVSVVTLAGNILEPNELLGCEIRGWTRLPSTPSTCSPAAR